MTTAPHDICRDIYKKLESIQQIRHLGIREIFDDFCTITMASFHNLHYSIGGRPVPEYYRANCEQMEADYQRAIKKYDSEGKSAEIFAEILADLALTMYKNPFDYLGKIYMNANISNKGHGQFFTPPHICELMAKMTIGNKENFEQQVLERGYVGMADPCCGSGGMAVALAKVLGKEYGVQGLDTKLLIKLTDIDYTCVKMAFINMSLLGLSARIIYGDTITGCIDGQFDTVALQTALALGTFHKPETPATPQPIAENITPRQLTLF